MLYEKKEVDRHHIPNNFLFNISISLYSYCQTFIVNVEIALSNLYCFIVVESMTIELSVFLHQCYIHRLSRYRQPIPSHLDG